MLGGGRRAIDDGKVWGEGSSEIGKSPGLADVAAVRWKKEGE